MVQLFLVSALRLSNLWTLYRRSRDSALGFFSGSMDTFISSLCSLRSRLSSRSIFGRHHVPRLPRPDAYDLRYFVYFFRHATRALSQGCTWTLSPNMLLHGFVGMVLATLTVRGRVDTAATRSSHSRAPRSHFILFIRLRHFAYSFHTRSRPYSIVVPFHTSQKK